MFKVFFCFVVPCFGFVLVLVILILFLLYSLFSFLLSLVIWSSPNLYILVSLCWFYICIGYVITFWHLSSHSEAWWSFGARVRCPFVYIPKDFEKFKKIFPFLWQFAFFLWLLRFHAARLLSYTSKVFS